MPARVLIIEDEYALAAALATVVRRLGAEPVVAASGQGGLDKVQRQAFDAVLLDIGLPDMSGLKVLAALRAAALATPVLVITAHGTLDNALEARRLGAREYFLKPLNVAELQASLKALLAESAGSAGAGPPAERLLMTGAAPAMQRVFALLAQAGPADVPVLLTGPHGAGKTLAAEVIAGQSPERPLHRYRCDEWFAEQAGAELQRSLEAAAGGTLLIEEVGLLPLPLQAVLARALGQGGFRLLSTATPSLQEALAAGRFREDLFYQLAVLQIPLPPLTERTEDLPELAAQMLRAAAPERDWTLAPETLACLKAHGWPGNVRELAAAMRHAAAVCPVSPILPRHLPAALQPGAGETHLDAALQRSLLAWLDLRLTGAEADLPDYDTLLAGLEKPLLADLLRRFDDKPTRLAAALRMNRATLRRKLRELLGRD